MENHDEDALCAACEAILFSMGEAVDAALIAKALDVDAGTVKKIIDRLADSYKEADRGISLAAFDGAYQLCTKREMYDYVARAANVPKPKTLTDVMLETLSIIAYRQPVTKLEIEKIRGVRSDRAVNKLIEYGLVCEAGRKDAPGRPILFATTEEFLRYFGIESIDGLPALDAETIEEFKQEAEAEAGGGEK